MFNERIHERMYVCEMKEAHTNTAEIPKMKQKKFFPSCLPLILIILFSGNSLELSSKYFGLAIFETWNLEAM